MELCEYVTSQVKTIVPTVYSNFNPDSEFPCCVIESVFSDPVQCMGESVSFEKYEYEITVWDTSKSAAHSKSRLIRELLDNTSIYGIININAVMYIGQSEDYMDLTGVSGRLVNETARVYGITLNFEFWVYI